MGASRVGIVGCGRMGTTRAQACQALGVDVALLVDANVEAAEALAAKHPGSRIATQAAPPLLGGLDAIFICTPPGSRQQATDAAIAARLPMFFEKPVGITAQSVMGAAEAIESASIRNAVGFHNRYRASVQSARTALAADPPFAVAGHWIGPAYSKPWWLDPSESGGPINDQAIHLVDLCRYLVGEIAEVGAHQRHSAPRSAPDSVAITLRFRADACGVLIYSHLAQTKSISFEAFNASGSVHLEGWDLRCSRSPAAVEDDVFVTETAAFLGLSGEILCTFGDALQTQAVVDLIRESARRQPSTIRHRAPGRA